MLQILIVLHNLFLELLLCILHLVLSILNLSLESGYLAQQGIIIILELLVLSSDLSDSSIQVIEVSLKGSDLDDEFFLFDSDAFDFSRWRTEFKALRAKLVF